MHSDEMRRTINWLHRFKNYGFNFPNTYIVFDLETSGLIRTQDLAIQIGYLVVEDGVIVNRAYSHNLDWTVCDKVDQAWLRRQLLDTATRMHEKGSSYRFTYDGLKAGIDPVPFLETCHTWFDKWQNEGNHFLTHNGFSLDCPMMEAHFERFCNKPFKFNTAQCIDTGLIEKSAQQPYTNIPTAASLNTLYTDIANTRSRVKWSLTKHCAQKYDLVNKHNLDLTKAHSADFDCYVTHLLYQEYRKLVLGEVKDSCVILPELIQVSQVPSWC